MLLATVAKNELIALDKNEAEEIAKAYADLAVFYPAMQQSDKAVAWFNLFAALGIVYGTRVAAHMNNVRTAKAEKEANAIRQPGGQAAPIV